MCFSTKLKVKYLKGTEKPKLYELLEPIVYNDIIVPSGVITDFASVPIGLQWLYKPTGKYSRSAVLHDYLYTIKDFPRYEADLIFLEAMKCDKVPFHTRWAFYLAVLLFGEDRKL